jgi:hypothetical protein
MFNDYIIQLHVSAPTGHLQVVFKRSLHVERDLSITRAHII